MLLNALQLQMTHKAFLQFEKTYKCPLSMCWTSRCQFYSNYLLTYFLTCWRADLYTVKRLETGGFEVEFPRAEYLLKIREELDKRYPTTKWHDSACKQEATLRIPRPGLSLSTGRYRVGMPTCQLLVQLGSAIIGERRLLVSDAKPSSSGHQQHAGAWIDTELCVMYRGAHQSLQQQQQLCVSATPDDM